MDITTLIPGFGGLGFTVVAFVLALLIIVFVHEFGHYIVGRWSGIHADVFSLGFGPVIWSRIDKHGTRWQLAALPFGGYVKFFGDTNAASGGHADGLTALTDEQRRATMHGAPLWARSATVAAGPVFNFILSITIFAGLFLAKGIATDIPVVGTLKPIPAEVQELQPGDTILAVGGTRVADFAAFIDQADALPPASVVTYTVRRDGAEQDVRGPFPMPPVADNVAGGSAADEAGLEAGDVVLSVNGTPIAAFSQLRDMVGASDGKPLTLQVWRGGETFEAQLQPRRMDLPLADGGFETRWLIGVSGNLFFTPETRTPGLWEAVTLGAGQAWTIAYTSVSGLWHMITGAISSCNLQGPLGIAETSGQAASMGISSFIWFVAMLSTAVGLMNLFPVPVLDGGHLVFFAYEAVAGKPPTARALNVMMSLGLALILGLMAFALTNDIFCP